MGLKNSPTTERNAQPRPPLEWTEKAARDRISSTIFIAALFHGVVILGVTFSNGELPDFSTATSLDVVLVTSESNSQQASEDARLLAQQSMQGSGNTSEENRLQTALTRSSDGALGPDRDGSEQALLAGEQTSSRRLLMAAGQADWQSPLDPGEQQPASQQRTAMPGDISFIEIVNEPENSTLISSAGPRELVISASTRESRIAAYLSGWKRQVERVGTLNFPRQVSNRGATQHPTLEVAIAADGILKQVVVRNSSGQRSIDDAAVEILKIASPFEPFPEILRSDYDVLRFAYEWRFGSDPGVAQLSVRDDL